MKTSQQVKQINGQTDATLHVGHSTQVMDAYGNLVATLPDYGAGISPAGYVSPWHLTEANSRLFAASFNAFNHAGRALGIDASELAESLDLVGLIHAAQALVSEFDHDTLGAGTSARLLALERQLAKIPKKG